MINTEFDVPDAVAFTMATVALFYPLLKDFWEKPKVNVYAYIANHYNPDTKEQAPELFIKITNIGGHPLVVDDYAFRDLDGEKFLLPDDGEQFSQKRLDPYDSFSVKLHNPLLKILIEHADQLGSFAVYDTKGKRWPLPKKVFKRVKASLKQCGIS